MNLVKTYTNIKEKHPDCIVLIREDEKYISINADAHRIADVLKTEVTHNGLAKTEFSRYSLDAYLPKLIKAGLRIAICDELK